MKNKKTVKKIEAINMRYQTKETASLSIKTPKMDVKPNMNTIK